MSGTAHNLDQEFWRPPVSQQASSAPLTSADLCPHCQADYVVGARFCHVCGNDREVQPEVVTHRFTRYLDFAIIREALGLTIGSLIAFIVGIGCVIAAIAVGFMYTATTVLDWQAVQVWRIEWLLAATTAFVAGILLKRST